MENSSFDLFPHSNNKSRFKVYNSAWQHALEIVV